MLFAGPTWLKLKISLALSVFSQKPFSMFVNLIFLFLCDVS